MEDAIRIFTISGARALNLAGVTGSVEPGKFADLIVLERNLFSVPINDLGDTQVEKTFFRGQLVHQNRD